MKLTPLELCLIMVLSCSFLVTQKGSDSLLSHSSGSYPNLVSLSNSLHFYAEVDPPVVNDTTICNGESIIIAPEGCPMVTTVDSVLFEDFEDAIVEYSSSIPEATDSDEDYWIRTDGTNINGESFENIQGSSYFAAHDILDVPGSSSSTASLTFSNIDISGLTDLQFSALFAEDDDGGNQDWDAGDSLHIFYAIDGGSFNNLFWIESTGTNTVPQIDTDFDGVGDGTAITDTFTNYTTQIAGTGSILDLRIVVTLNAGDEDIAFDNLTISGRRLSSDPMCSFNFYSSLPTATDTMRIVREVNSYEFIGLTSDTTVYISKVEEGCESMIIPMTITVSDTTSTIIDSMICMGDMIEFNGLIITDAGTYGDTLQNVAMCDSFITLNVTVATLPELLPFTSTLCNNQTSNVDLSSYNTEFTSSTGSFSYIKREPILFTDLIISEYLEGSGSNKCLELYNGTGSAVDLSAYSIDIIKPNAGDRKILLIGSLPADSVFVICDNGTTIFNEADTIVTQLDYNGDDAVVLLNGTDSIDIIGQVNVDPGARWGAAPVTTENHTIVRNPNVISGDTDGSDAFDPASEWIGLPLDVTDSLGRHRIIRNYTKSSISSEVVDIDNGDEYCVIFTDMATNCIDSTILQFVVNDTSSAVIDSTICAGESIEFNGITIEEAGSYRDTLINAMMCDSFVTLNVILLDTSSTVIDSKICAGESIEFNGLMIRESGRYRDTLINAVMCDSFITLNVILLDTSSTVIDSTICAGESIEFNGTTIEEAGSYRDTLINAVMCDSFITLNVILLDTSSTIVDSTICVGESIEFNGMNIEEAGSYRDTLINAVMCDSFITLNLTIEECMDCMLDLSVSRQACAADGEITLDIDLSVDRSLSDSFIVVLDSVPVDTVAYTDLGSGIFSLGVGPASNQEREIVVYDKASDFGGIELSEVLADPPSGMTGDANQDGIRDSGDDEFIELVNTSRIPINIGGYQLFVGGTLEHTFIDTLIPSGGVVVLFSGGDLSNLSASSASYFVNSSALQLANSGDEIRLLDKEGNLLFSYTYGSEGADDQSLVNNGLDSLIRISETSTVDLFTPGVNDFTLLPIVDESQACSDTLRIIPDPCPAFDLALSKKLSTNQNLYVNPGEVVAFDITIFNQGRVTAYDIRVRDYIPSELAYDLTLNHSNWGVDSTYNQIDSLDAGQDTTLQIYLKVKEEVSSGSIVNSAEILFASYEPGGPLASDEDDDLANLGGNNEIDDNVDDPDGNSNPDLAGDQDDFDLARLRLCDNIRFTTPAVEDIAICDSEFSGIVTIKPDAVELPTELFFSEYIEGPVGLNNKCIEIFNGTGGPVDLSAYSINLYNTAPRMTPDRMLCLTGSIADGDVLVLCNNSTFTAEADIVDPNIIAFNGDDIVTLSKNGVVVDAIGQIGFDPGAQWISNGISTMDQTLRRKMSIIKGDDDPNNLFVTELEWVSLGDNINDPADLGQHTIIPPQVGSFTFYDADPLTGGNILAEQVASLDTMVSAANSPVKLWVVTQPLNSSCISEAKSMTIGIHGSSSSMTCLGEVNLNVDSSCSIINLPINAYYQGPIDPIFLTVRYRLPNGTYIDPADISGVRREQLIYEVLDTCTQAICWGYVNIESKNYPNPIIVPSDTICCTDDVLNAVAFTPDQVLDSLNSLCFAAIVGITEEVITRNIYLCDTSLTQFRYYADFEIKNAKERRLIYTQDVYSLPIPIDSIRSPGSSNFPDSSALIDSILIQACGQLSLDPLDVAHYWAEQIDPSDENNNGDHEGIPYAYPYIVKDSLIVMDTTFNIIESDRIIGDTLVNINGIWTVVDVLEHSFDTTFTIEPRVVYNYQKIAPDRTCNIHVKYTDHYKDSCYPDGKLFRKWSLIDWCSKEVRELEQWIIVGDIEPPVFGVLPVDIVLLGLDSAIVNGSDTVPIGSIGSLVNVDELFEVIYVSDAFECEADLAMPQFSKLEDNCTIYSELKFNYLLSGFPAEVSADGQTIRNVPAGVNELTIIATDACGNSAQHIMTIIVLDGAPPIAQCQEQIRVSYVHSDGSFNRLPLDVIDDGSYDICGDIVLRLGKRLDNKVFCDGSILTFIGTEYIEYCCEDIGNIIPVELTVFDNFGNTAVCITQVIIEDKSESVVICHELIVDCKAPSHDQLLSALDLSLSSCVSEEITFDQPFGPGSCGGSSELVGVYVDGVKSCDIEVHYETGAAFDPYSIKWPIHRDGSSHEGLIRECVEENGSSILKVEEGLVYHNDVLICDASYNLIEPTWCESYCNLIGVSYELINQEYNETCETEVLDWTIIDWCLYTANGSNFENDVIEPLDDYWLDVHDMENQGNWLANLNNGDDCETCDIARRHEESRYYRYAAVQVDGYYTYRQKIKLLDLTPPVISVAMTDTIQRSVQDPCGHQGSITAGATDFCLNSQLTETNLNWKVIINAYIGEHLHKSDTVYSRGEEFTVEFIGSPEINSYSLIWKVVDACGNSATKSTNIEIVDQAVDAPICLRSISLGQIDETGLILTPADILKPAMLTCNAHVNYGLSWDSPNALILDYLELNCNQLTDADSINLRLWIVDGSGNQNYCLLALRYRLDSECQDQQGIIKGAVTTIHNQSMPDVTIELLNSEALSMVSKRTDDSGGFQFENDLPEAHTLRASHNSQSFDGVSTLDLILLQHHILGLNRIEDPYTQWAGDINQDGQLSAIDISVMKKALLGIDQQSMTGRWKFMDASFPVNQIAQNIDYPETITLQDHSQPNKKYNFYGALTGDINGDSYDTYKVSRTNSRLPVTISFNENEETLMAELLISDNRGIAGMELELVGELHRYTDLLSSDIHITENDHYSTDDRSRVIWVNNTDAIQSSFTIQFRLPADQTFSLHSMVDWIQEDVVLSLWTYDYEEYQAEFIIKRKETNKAVSVTPNPFRESAILRVEGIGDRPFDLLIFDSSGRIIYELESDYIIDPEEVTIQREQLSGPGIYYYQLKSENDLIYGRFIMIN